MRVLEETTVEVMGAQEGLVVVEAELGGKKTELKGLEKQLKVRKCA